MATKGNPDYSNTAVNLCNPDSVRKELEFLANRKAKLSELEKTAETFLPATLRKAITEIKAQIADSEKGLRGLIDKDGSYQDTITGRYGVKQSRKSTTYSAILVRRTLPVEVANRVIIEVVDNNMMEAAIKSKLVDEKAAAACGETNETFAYIIRC